MVRIQDLYSNKIPINLIHFHPFRPKKSVYAIGNKYVYA